MSLNKHGWTVAGCIFAFLAAVLSSKGPAYAGCISQKFGHTTYYNCGGRSGTSHKVGNTTIHNFGGKSGMSHKIGNTTIHNFGGKSGMSHKVGGITVHSGSLFNHR